LNRPAAALALFAAAAAVAPAMALAASHNCHFRHRHPPAPPPVSYACHDTPLVKVAADLGYSYGYLGPEDAVALSRPGVTVVIRPGERLFDVNDRTESVDGPAPHFYRNDVYICDELYARLRQIAARYPSVPGGQRAIVVVNPNAAGAAAVSGAITNLTLTQVPGAQSVAVTGRSPASLPITLTLSGTFSNELPDVVLNRTLLTADADGTFKTTVPVASGFFRGAILTMVASSVTGVTPARTKIVLKAPNDAVTVPAEQEPRGIR